MSIYANGRTPLLPIQSITESFGSYPPRFLDSPRLHLQHEEQCRNAYGFDVIVVHAASATVDYSEFGFGYNERICGGKLFRRRVHEFIHTVLSRLSHQRMMRDNPTHIS